MPFTIGPRLEVFEIGDQTWFPQYLRTRIQECLTFCWSVRSPFPRDGTASTALVSVLKQILGSTISSYTYVDFCAGAGGPTPIIERDVNKQLRKEGLEPVKFVLTDLWPNPEAWKIIERKSGGMIRWVPQGVDAGKAPGKEVLLGQDEGTTEKKKIFRMFNLAFHHFHGDGAGRIVKDAITGSDAMGIFEIQSRTPLGFFQVFMIGPLLTFLGPFHKPFWSIGHMFFTYIIPILPFVMVFDGYMSALRTRTPEEIMKIIEQNTTEEERKDWKWHHGTRKFAQPFFSINYFIGVKEEK